MMTSELYLSVFPSHDNRMVLTQKVSQCEARRSPLIKVQWSHTTELLVHIGYIQHVEEKDMRMISLTLSAIAQTRPFMATCEEIKLYGSAIVVRIEPYEDLLRIHKKLNQKLQESSQGQLQFNIKNRFDPYLLIGRIKNLNALNALHKTQFLQLLSQMFQGYAFLVQQAALLRRLKDDNDAGYQLVQPYSLRG